MEILCCPCCGHLGQVLLTQQEYADRFAKPPELALPSGQAAPQHIPAAQPQRQHAGGQPRGGGGRRQSQGRRDSDAWGTARMRTHPSARCASSIA
jgi:hypothetical protein